MMNFFHNVFLANHVKVDVVLKNSVFYPGNIIEGVVTVTAHSPLTFTAIRLKVCGKEKVECVRRESEPDPTPENPNNRKYVDRKYNESNVVHKQLITLAGDLKYQPRGGQYPMPPGTFHYPFAYQLPSDLPPSFSKQAGNDHAAILYYVKAYVDIPMGRDAVSKAFFTLVRPIPQSQWMERAPASVDRTWDVTCCCCIDKGKVGGRIFMDRTFIAIDRDWLQLFAEIDNTNGQEPVENLVVSLRHTLRYTASGVTETNTYVAGSKMIGTPILPGAKGQISAPIDLPRNLIPTLRTPNVTSSYMITIEMSIPWATDPVQSFPVIVGQSVDETNCTPRVNFNEVPAQHRYQSSLVKLPCPEFYYMPPPQPVYNYAPVSGWAAPPNAQYFTPPQPQAGFGYLPSQTWQTQAQPSYGQPPQQASPYDGFNWQQGYQQQQAADIDKGQPPQPL